MSNRIDFNTLLQNSSTIDDALATLTRKIPGTKPKNFSKEEALVELTNGILNSKTPINKDHFHKLVELDKKLIQVSPKEHEKLYAYCIKLITSDNTTQQKALGLLSKSTVYEQFMYKLNQMINFYLGRFFNKDKELAESSFSKQAATLQYIGLFTEEELTPELMGCCVQLGSVTNIDHEILLPKLKATSSDKSDLLRNIVWVFGFSGMSEDYKLDLIRAIAMLSARAFNIQGIADLIDLLSHVDEGLLRDTVKAIEVIPENMRTLENIKSAKKNLWVVKLSVRNALIEEFKNKPDNYFSKPGEKS